MQIKFITAASFLALTAATQANAADLTKHHTHTAPAAIAKPVVLKPNFSWTGLYAGAQGSSDWGKHKFDLSATKTTRTMGAKFTEKLDQFGAGLFAGFNHASPNGAVFGVETDMIWKNQEGNHNFFHPADPTKDALEAAKKANKHLKGMTADSIKELHTSFKEKWTGATRVRLGFAKGKILPYIAGGIAYSNILTNANLVPGPATNTAKALTIANKSTTMIGWTAGAGVDCALANNLLVRLEYRYSDFGKKSLKYSGENKQSFLYDFKHNTNDVRVGVAYKF